MQKRIVLVAFAVLFAGLVSSAAERGDDWIRCESTGDKATYCKTHTTGRVELVKQLSRARCDQYDTWGSDDDGGGIWVRNGCRAEFVVREESGWGHGRHGHHHKDHDEGLSSPAHVRCASQDWSYGHCEVDGRPHDARIVKQISKTRCERGDNWDIDRDGVWVDRGCEAEFEVR